LKVNSIQIKIISLIIIILFLTLTGAVYISVTNQKKDLLEAAKKTLAINMDFLNITIKNIMLSGEAPLAINTIKGLKGIIEFKEAELYRKTGDVAFFDYQTLNFVNSYQNRILFPKTDRVDRKILENPYFQLVLEKYRPIDNENSVTKEMEYFFPIRNEQECWQCHSDPAQSGSLRGIAHFKVSIAGIYQQIDNARNLLIMLFLTTGILIGIILIVLLRRMIIKPLFLIGNKVLEFGAGNYELSLNIQTRDELGELASKINDMFIATKERIKLSKYISKSTEAIIKKGDSGLSGEKKEITVLFSDIRGFTNYSESHDPKTVIENLNIILETQAKIVEKFGGDIDKFVGDMIMAIFDDEYTAVKCAYELIISVMKINKTNNTSLLIGVGVNSGEVVIGHIGSENRLEYAVIGDTVNLASRLCSIARPNMLLISESIYEKVKDKVNAKLVPNQKIKGKSKSVNFYVVKSV
jgi:class 3 adenylate cyclase